MAPVGKAAANNGRTERVPEPARSDRMAGELITQTFDYDGGRQVTVYLPPGRPQAAVFGGDGQLISRWGEYLEAADSPPTMIVGVYRSDSEDEMDRLREYSAAFDVERFAAHERFFVYDVREWVRSRFGVMLLADRTAVSGVSASAEFSLAMGLRHPDLYSTVFAASPGGGYRPPSVMPNALPRTYLTAGTLEPFFLDNATRWAEALRTAGADVVMSEQVGDHGDPFWQAEFLKMVDWAFGS
ncbi:alpha/beta hydrolase [Rhizobium leguminosarum]|nr:alpha/beta hydrolase-fold protein [Rhizobium leguminosarum]